MTIAIPTLSSLTDDEQLQVNVLSNQLMARRFWHELSDHYYDGTMRIQSLGIAIPPKLAGLRTVIGWPRVVVDAVDERLDVEGFRYQDSTDADMDLWDIWQANNLDEESQLGHLDALVFGSAFTAVGSPDSPGDQPLITVESPLNMVSIWDPRSRQTTSAFREYVVGQIPGYQVRCGTLYLPDSTISLEMAVGGWMIVDRDDHNLGQVPVVRLQNRSRTHDRLGRSEITAEVMSITDAACRTLLGMEVAREFFGAPQRYILGAGEEAFQDAEGNAKDAWATYTGRILGLERDEDGNVPAVGTFAAGNPTAFTSVLEAYAKIMSTITGLPSDYLGINSTIPASAEAIRMSTDRLINKVRRKQRAFDSAWEETMRLAILIRDGKIPPEAKSMETLWRNPEIPTIAATTTALLQQEQAGFITSNSDVALEKLGYSAVERERIAVEKKSDAAEAELAALATSIEAKEARTGLAVAADLGIGKTPTAPSPAAPAPPPAAPPASGH